MYTIRKAVPADAAWCGYVNVVSWRDTYAGIVDDGVLARMDAVARTRVWSQIISQDSTTTFVAVDPDGRVVGYGNGGPERDGDSTYTGELYAIYLLPEVKGKGLGRQLLQAVAQWLYEQGHRGMLVWVLKDNVASAGFYAAMGGRQVGEKTIKIGRELVEVAYGWDDLGNLPLAVR